MTNEIDSGTALLGGMVVPDPCMAATFESVLGL